MGWISLTATKFALIGGTTIENYSFVQQEEHTTFSFKYLDTS